MNRTGIARSCCSLMFTLLLVACGRPEIDRTRWLGMSPADKRLTVDSLRGREVAKAHKGGAYEMAHPLRDDEYVALIDRTYRSGDQRTVTTIWDSLPADARGPARSRGRDQ